MTGNKPAHTKKRRYKIEGLLLVVCAALAFVGVCIGQQPISFHHIRELALSADQHLVVLDESGDRYTFWRFDANGRLIDKMIEKKEMVSNGPRIAYLKMAEHGGSIYLQQETYSDDGLLMRHQIVKKTAGQTETIYQCDFSQAGHEVYLTGNLTVADNKLFFITRTASSFSLLCYDPLAGQTETIATFQPPPFSWDTILAYIGDGQIIMADEDSQIWLFHTASPAQVQKIEQAGSVSHFAVTQQGYAYFDLHEEKIILHISDTTTIVPAKQPALSPSIFLLADKLYAIETGAQLNGKNILHTTWDDTTSEQSIHAKTWQSFQPAWTFQAGAVHALPYTFFILFAYAAVRLWLFLLLEKHLTVSLRAVLIVVPLTACFFALFYTQTVSFMEQQSVAAQKKNLQDFMQHERKIETIKALIQKCDQKTPATDPNYLAIEQELFELTGIYHNGVPGRRLFYFGVVMVEDDNYYSFCYGIYPNSIRKNGLLHYVYKATAMEIFERCAVQREEGYFTVKGETEYYLYQTPIYRNNNELTAVLEVGINLSMVQMDAIALVRRQAFMVLLFVAALIGTFVFVIHFVLRSLTTLKSGVERIASGENHVQLPVHTKDELGEIARAFNLMSLYVDQKKRDGRIYGRFVPEEITILTNQHANKAEDVTLGQYACANRATLFFAYHKDENNIHATENIIRDLNGIASIVQKENGHLRQMDGMHGFCLFHTTLQALEAAFAIIRHYGERVFCIAIDECEATVAVLGNDDRFQMSFYTASAEILPLLCRKDSGLEARVLLTEDAFHAIEVAALYRYRYIGKVKVDRRIVGLYDFFDADNEAVHHMKSNSLADFNDGCSFFYQHHDQKASDKFVRVLKKFPGDRVSRQYLALCEEEGDRCLTIDTARH